MNLSDNTNLIDFHGASHGHFLEYLINSWIYNGPRVDKVFTEPGTSHMPGRDKRYVSSRKIHCGHFSEEIRRGPSSPGKLVRITVDSEWGKWIHVINIMHRIGDITLEKSYSLIPDQVVASPAKLRNEWFDKLSRDDYSQIIWKWPEFSFFEFPMESLYNCFDLYRTMHDCAKFLELKFSPDVEFYQVWQEFLEKNQGLQIYNSSQKIISCALGKISMDFQASVPEQALINLMLSKAVGMYDGALFENDQYPTNTLEMWEHINYYQETYDSRF